MGYNFNRFNVDAFEDGEWCNHPDGGIFKIAKMNNPRHRDAYRVLEKQFRKDFGDELDAEQQDRLHAAALAEGVLRDWAEIDGKEDGKTVAVPYTVENATELLVRDPKLVQWVARKATDLERFENADQEAQAKKPGKR